MNNQEPDLNPTPAETDSAKTNESVQREGSELPVDQRSSYLRSRQIALKKFSPQGGTLAEKLSENAQASLRTIRWIMAILIQASLVRGLIS